MVGFSYSTPSQMVPLAFKDEVAKYAASCKEPLAIRIGLWLEFPCGDAFTIETSSFQDKCGLGCHFCLTEWLDFSCGRPPNKEAAIRMRELALGNG